MIYLATLFFVIIFFVIYKHRGFDVSAYVSLLYVITSICGIIAITFFPLQVYTNLSVSSVFSYCLLVAISIIPIYNFDSKKLTKIIVRNTRTIDFMVYLYFIGFLFTIFVYREDIMFRILYNDFGELRDLVYQGNSYDISHLSGIGGLVEKFFGFINQASFLMFPVFFISICFLRRPWWYNLFAILGASSVILTSILNIERSSSFKWMIILMLNYVLFLPFYTKRIRKRIIPIVSGVMVLVVLYFSAVTVSRFHDSDSGTEGGVITYSAKPFLGYCNFYDNYESRTGYFTMKTLFPGFHTYVLKDHSGGVGYQQEMTHRSNMECGTFYSFLGWFILDMGQVGPYVFIVFYTLLFLVTLSFKRNNSITLVALLANYSLIIIPTYGCIAYPYMYGSSTYSVLSVIALISILESFKLRKNIK